MLTLVATVKRHPLVWYYVLACVFTWICITLMPVSLMLVLLGLWGPAVAAALNRAFAGVATELAAWTASAITEPSQPKGVVPKKATGD